MTENFPKSYKLKGSKNFDKTLPRKRIYNNFFTVLKRPNGLDHWRLGIIITRKVGNAVERNRIKRYIREYFRKYINKNLPIDFIVIPKHSVEIKRENVDFSFAVK